MPSAASVLLAFADRQRPGERVRIEAEAVPGRRGGQLGRPGLAVDPRRAGAAEQEVVEHGERAEHQRVLVEHADAGLAGIAG